jgi:hypothetical protein
MEEEKNNWGTSGQSSVRRRGARTPIGASGNVVNIPCLIPVLWEGGGRLQSNWLP